MKIFKYPMGGECVWLPHGAKPIHVAEQNGTICVWAEVPDEESAELPKVQVLAVPTGGHVIENMHHIGSLLLMGGTLVFHFYWFQP